MDLTKLKSQRKQVRAAVAAGKCIVYGYLRSKDSATAKAGTLYYVGVTQSNPHRPYVMHVRGGKGCNLPIPKRAGLIRILAITDTVEEMKRLERAFIAHYGRCDLGTGILRNLTEGGDGTSGYTHSEEAKRVMSDLKKGVYSPHVKERHEQQMAERALELKMPLDTYVAMSNKDRKKLASFLSRNPELTWRDYLSETKAERQARVGAARKVDNLSQGAKKYNVPLTFWARLTVTQRGLVSKRYSSGMRGKALMEGIYPGAPDCDPRSAKAAKRVGVALNAWLSLTANQKIMVSCRFKKGRRGDDLLSGFALATMAA